jgi:hypothetical protein
MFFRFCCFRLCCLLPAACCLLRSAAMPVLRWVGLTLSRDVAVVVVVVVVD